MDLHGMRISTKTANHRRFYQLGSKTPSRAAIDFVRATWSGQVRRECLRYSAMPTTPTKPKAKATPITTTKVVTTEKPARARMTLAETMRALEKAGSAQTRKTYARHGAHRADVRRQLRHAEDADEAIGVDHELALALWDTGNFDARNLAVKIVDPARMTSGRPRPLGARSVPRRGCAAATSAMLAAESPHGADEGARVARVEGRAARATPPGRSLGQLAQRDETTPDAYFEKRLAEIERTIHAAPNDERDGMNMAVIAIGVPQPGAAQGRARRRQAHRQGRGRPRRHRLQDAGRRRVHREDVGPRDVEGLRVARRARARARSPAAALLTA